MTKQQSKLSGFLITCGECGEDNHLTHSQSSVESDDYECGSCGSHGHIIIKTWGETCANCSARLTDVMVNEW